MKNETIMDFIKELKYELEDLEIRDKSVKLKYIDREMIDIYINKLKVIRNESGKIEVVIETLNKELVKILDFTNLQKDEDGFLENNDLIIEYEEFPEEISLIFENIFRTNLRTSIGARGEKFIITLETSRKFICKKNSSYKVGDKVILKEWYTNGLKHIKIFSDFLTENYEVNYENGLEKIKRNGSNHTRNAVINLGDMTFKINQEEGEKNISIEYSDEYGEIPTEKTREKISLILSFIMDRKLIKLGESSYYYDNQNKYSSHTLFESMRYSVDGKELSHLSDGSQVFFSDKFFYSKNSLKEELDNFKKTLEKIIKNYLIYSEHYKLDNIIHRYLDTKKIALDYSIPIWVTGLEMLATIVSKDEKLEKIIDEESFNEFLKKIIDVPEKLKNKVRNLNNIGIGQKLIKLLEVFNLDYERYRVAFKTRNDLNHGSTKVSVAKMVLSNNLLKELTIIIILTLLEYDYIIELNDGEYIKL